MAKGVAFVMRLVTWNTNHRAARRRIPSWVGDAVIRAKPDVAVLTEYVEGLDHVAFLERLGSAGLEHFAVSPRQGRSNQVLIASRKPVEPGDLIVPPINQHVTANILHLRSGLLNVIGFRMPDFQGRDAHLKRETWTWLNGALMSVSSRPAIIAGDFNTAPGDSTRHCGDCFEALAHAWTLASPVEGCSFRYSSGTERRIDHAFVTSSVTVRECRYSWDFRDCSGTSEVGPGHPDHAMLVVDVEVNDETTVDGSRRGP